MNARRSHKGRIILIALLMVFAFLLYLILGATVPFMAHPTVSQAYKTAVYQTIYTGETESPERVALLENNEAALGERLRMISQAEERIVLATFDWRNDNSGTDIAAALWEAAERGVQIQILVDGASAQTHMGGAVFTALGAHPNVEIRIYNPVNPLKPATFNGRMHDKYLIVDKELYLLGGRNICDFFLGSYPTDNPSRDRELLVWSAAEGEGRSIDTLLAYFEGIWELDCCRAFRDDETLLEKKKVQKAAAELEKRAYDLHVDYYHSYQELDYGEYTVSANQITLLSNPTHTGVKEPQVLYALTELMKETGEDVELHTPYAVCSKEMYQDLSEIAEAVPSFALVVNSVENGDNVMASSDYLRSKGALLDTGVTLWEYNGGESYHGKSLVMGSRLSAVGSFNWDMRSAYLDTELMLVVDSPELNTQLRGYMAEFRQQSLRCVTEDSYEDNPAVMVPALDSGKKRLLKALQVLTRPIRFLL